MTHATRCLLALLALLTVPSCGPGEAETTQTYWCPMCPQIGHRARPGMCPICNMELVVFEGDATGDDPGVLQLTDRQVQQAGVRIGRAATRMLVREIDALGRLSIAPRRRHTIALRFPGKSRIEKVHGRAAGAAIHEGQVLAELTNSTMAQTLRDYRRLLADYGELRGRGVEGGAAPLLAEANGLKQRFVTWGVPAGFVDVLANKAKHLFTEPVFPVRAPAGGVLLDDVLLEVGGFVAEGTTLFDIGDLSELWLHVEIFENDRPLIAAGDRITFTTAAVPGETFTTSLRGVEPTVAPRTQATRARAVVPNRDGRLAPGMVVDARLHVGARRLLAVPESAVQWSGRRDVVIVSEGDGKFRPKLVRIGRRHMSVIPGMHGHGADTEDMPFGAAHERYHEVLRGLDDGDRVVLAGAFLLQAEAQFQGVMRKMLDAAAVEEKAPPLPDDVVADIETVLNGYFTVGRALVADDAGALPALGADLTAPARRLVGAGIEHEARIGTLGEATLALAEHLQGNDLDLEAVRRSYGTASRALVDYLLALAPTRLTNRDLHTFRCPMAEDYGYDVWVQDNDRLRNPYMGQRMPRCGSPVDLL